MAAAVSLAIPHGKFFDPGISTPSSQGSLIGSGSFRMLITKENPKWKRAPHGDVEDFPHSAHINRGNARIEYPRHADRDGDDWLCVSIFVALSTVDQPEFFQAVSFVGSSTG